MVIQSFNVNVSSQRSFLSASSTSMTAAGSQNSAQYAGSTGQGGSSATTNTQAAGQPNENQNGHGQNQNGQGNNGNGNGNIGLGQNQNGNGNNNGNGNGNTGLGQNQNGNGNIGLGQNKNGNEQNVNNQGQTQNEQEENIITQRQNNRDRFRSMLENAREESVDRLSRGSRASRVFGARHQKRPTSPLELRAHLSQLIYEMLTGRLPANMQKSNQFFEGLKESRSFDISFFFGGAFNTESVQRMQGAAGVQFESFQYESEEVSYQANGIIHTADGKTITVDINMQMSREFVSFMNISTNGRTLVDPLVINYGGTAASLTGEKFQFDLTMDGNLDTLAVLAEGSGFLAIDRNGDGIINDGSELFGPNTGCGFSELRKYDTDGNGWIDANDEIFDKLVVWSRDKDGNDTVYTLKELGIGAIFLGDISTEFSFKDGTNETLGVMRSTSFFLKSCGGAGTLSHIDLAM